MTWTQRDVVEMPTTIESGTMPTYSLIVDWLEAELRGLTNEQLDFDDLDPDREWMWWSIRRQISHMAWDSLLFARRRCEQMLWPDGNIPDLIVWDDHYMRPDAKWDRVLDETLFWAVPDLLDKLRVGTSWLTRVVTEQPIDVLRADTTTVRGTPFWAYVIQTLPRGAALVDEPKGHISYTLEGSLWMVFYELLTHVRTVQRLKEIQGLTTAVELPRVGYLRLPEYWGDTNVNGPAMSRLPVDTEPSEKERS